MTRISRLGALVALSAALSGQSGVHITTSGCGTSQAGLFVWGQLPAGTDPPAAVKAPCGTAATVAVTPDASGHNQLASFATGTAPQLLTPNWTKGPVSITQPAAAKVRVKFWLLVPDSHCGVSCIRGWLEDFLDWSNDFLERERAGVELVAADVAVVSDETGNSSPAAVRFHAVTQATDCTVSSLAELADNLKTPGALNMYLVSKVDGSALRGTVCFLPPPPRDMAFVGADAGWGTLLHEIGHLLGLGHSDRLPGLDERNLMWQTSDVREFVTAGQVFWMHFFSASALPRILGVRTGLAKDCDPTLSWPCPKPEAQIWPD